METKERIIKLNLTDEDVKALFAKAGSVGLSVGELIQGFVADLVCGIDTHGSDERDLAYAWFDRCGFAWFTPRTLLRHLLDICYDPERYLNLLQHRDNLERDIVEETDEEEIDFLREDLEFTTKELEEITKYWRPHYVPNMDEEISNIRAWIKERNELLQPTASV